MNIVLIGYRGVGKSTVARLLALQLGRPWVDADVEIELKAGKSIAAIFADEGEEAFRERESEVLEELLHREGLIIAAGGGVVLRETNRRRLQERSRVVWLRASPATIARRVAADATTAGRRPNLTTAGGQAEIELLLRERTPLYQQCAELSFDTERKDPVEIAADIARHFNLSPAECS